MLSSSIKMLHEHSRNGEIILDDCTKSTEVYSYKTMVFRASTNLPLLVDRGGKLLWSADEKASMISEHFDANQCTDRFQQPHSCDPSPVLCSVVFRSGFLCSLLLDLNPHGGNDLDGIFPLFTSRCFGSWYLT